MLEHDRSERVISCFVCTRPCQGSRGHSVTEATYCAGLILFRCVSGVYLICDIYEKLVIYKMLR